MRRGSLRLPNLQRRALSLPLFKVGDLKRMNVTLHMMLHSDREPIPDVPAIYFMQPTQDNIARVCADGAAGLYGSMALNFSSEVPRSLMEKLAGTMVANDAVNVVSGIFDQYTSFVSLEPTLFSLAERDVFPILNDPTMKDTAIIDCVERIVDGLFSFCVTMGSLPVIRCGRGGSYERRARAPIARCFGSHQRGPSGICGACRCIKRRKGHI